MVWHQQWPLPYRERHPRLPFADAPRGTCRLCGGDVGAGAKGTGRRWHALCSAYHKICTHSWATAEAWFRIYGGRGLHDQVIPCAHCGCLLSKAQLDVDHIVPVADGGLLHFLNLQPLCRSCHLAKTQREIAARAARVRRIWNREEAA